MDQLLPHSARKMPCNVSTTSATLPLGRLLKHYGEFVTMEGIKFHYCVFNSLSDFDIRHPYPVDSFHEPIRGDLYFHFSRLNRAGIGRTKNDTTGYQLWTWKGDGWLSIKEHGARHPDAETFPNLEFVLLTRQGNVKPKWAVIKGPRTKFKAGKRNRELSHAPVIPVHLRPPPPNPEVEDCVDDSEDEREIRKGAQAQDAVQGISWQPTLIWAELLRIRVEKPEGRASFDQSMT